MGPTNDKFVEVRRGLREGEQVLLNPPDILDQSQESGREISPDEDAKEKVKRKKQQGREQ